MNDKRRKALADVAVNIAALVKEIGACNFEGWANSLEGIKDDIDSIKNEEEEAFENLSDNLKGGEKGSRMEEVLEQLTEAVSSIEEVIEALNNVEWITELDDVIGKIEAARE